VQEQRLGRLIYGPGIAAFTVPSEYCTMPRSSRQLSASAPSKSLATASISHRGNTSKLRRVARPSSLFHGVQVRLLLSGRSRAKHVARAWLQRFLIGAIFAIHPIAGERSRRSRYVGAEHLQQCTEFLPLSNRGFSPLAVPVLAISFAVWSTAAGRAAV
jgi:hypothetical protein